MKACCLYVLIGEGTIQACGQDCYLHIMLYDFAENMPYEADYCLLTHSFRARDRDRIYQGAA